ncbi:MAG: general secretion pathway protein GspB [Pseudomonas sp.]|uniref:general secretion pathway protein GspB n=1 Tax=Pseudomonas sp. TaxID=306 RepID=UPI003BB4A74F
MSYILNALKHSESQRSRGEIPHVDSQPEFVTAAPNRLSQRAWQWALWLAVAVLLIGLGWVGLGGRAEDDRELPVAPPPAAVLAPPAATASLSVPNVAPVAVPPPAPGLPALQEMAGVRVRLGEAVQPLIPEPAQVNGVAASGPQVVLDLPVSSGFVPPANGPSSLSQPFPAQAGAPASVSETPAAERLNGVSHWKTAPPELQKQLRELAFTAHIYSINPASRFIRVSGHTLHEGDPLAAELQLLQITRDGLVLGYHGEKFWMGAN